MIRTDEHFDGIHSTESTFAAPRLEGRRLVVPSPKVVLSAHPLCARGWEACAGELVFEGVSFSRRVLVPYAGDPKDSSAGFLAEITQEDRVDPTAPGQRLYQFEGLYLGPPQAWIDIWEVKAERFFLVVPNDGKRPFLEHG